MSCEYCEITEGKKRAAKLYEDNKVVAFMSEQPATIGHIIVVPKKHLPIMEALDDDDLEHAFKIANTISIAVFESIKSEGTNILVQNGIEAGQESPHFSINIITRKSGDGLMFDWTPKQLGEQEMATIEIQLKEELGKPEISTEIPKEHPSHERTGLEKTDASGRTEGKKEAAEEKEENYLIKQLRRLP